MHVALVTGGGDPAAVERVDAPLVAALEQREVQVSHPVWHDDTVDWGGFDAAIVRTTWDYSGRRDEFVAWAESAGQATAVWNPPDVLRWNTHRSYLIELEERGAPVVPTAWLGRGDRVDVAELMASRDWTRAVLKPAVASGSDGVLLVSLDPDSSDDAETAVAQRHLDGLLGAGDALVQPYLASIERRGVLSVIVIDGAPSHAVRERWSDGDPSVETGSGTVDIETRSGRVDAPDTMEAEVAALARWVVEATGHELLFARVDLVEDDAGTLQLVELGATEPDLHLGVAPQAAHLLADAIVRRASG